MGGARRHVAVGHLAGVALGVISQLVLARALPLAAYGLYATLNSTAQLLSLPAKGGADVSAIRFVAAAQDESERWRFVRYTTARVLVLATTIAAGWAGFLIVSRQSIGVLIAAPLLLPLLCLLRLGEGVLRGYGRPGTAILGTTVVWHAGVAVGVGGVGFMVGFGAVPLSTALIIEASVLSAVVVWFGLAIQRAGLSARGGASGSPVSGERRLWRETALRMSLYASFAAILGQSDILIAAVLFQADQAAIYSVAWKVAAVVALPLGVVNYGSAARISRLYKDGDWHGLRGLIVRDSLLIAACSTAIAVIVLTASVPLLGLFGEAFTQGALVLAFLVGGQLANALGGPGALMLNMSGHESVVLRCLVVATVVNLLGSLALAQVMGPSGIAAGTCMAMVVFNVLLVWLAHRRTGLRVGVAALIVPKGALP